MRTPADCPAGRDRGAATLLVLAFGLFLTVAGVAAAGVGTARVGRHQARTAADLGALAGAAKAVYGPEVACARAGQFVAANQGRMASCVVDGLEIVVRAEVAVPGLGRHAVATARAGPISALPPTAPFAEPITPFAEPTTPFAEPITPFAEPITPFAEPTTFFAEPTAPSGETFVERRAIISVRD